jgi:hypothetical protein
VKRAIILILLITGVALGKGQDDKAQNNRQNKPNLSGTWELDKSKSKVTGDNPIMKGGAIFLTITHNEPLIRIVQKTDLHGREWIKEFLYYTDGRGENNPAANLYISSYEGNENPNSPSPRRTESKSKWKDNKVKIRYSIIVRIPDGRRTKVEVEEEWVMSPDGKMLTQTTSFSNNDSNFITSVKPRKLKKVFNKIS